MNKSLLILLTLLAIATNSMADSWTQKADVGTFGRYQGVAFSIGTKGYFGTGIDANGNRLNDFWEWDQATNTWTQMANFGGGVRCINCGFSIGTKGYIGTGNDGSIDYADFWEWDQSTNIWTQKSNYGGGAIHGAYCFSIGTKGYIGLGVDLSNNPHTDFWEWDQATDNWTQKNSFPSDGRAYGASFSIGTKGYIGLGVYALYYRDFWEWDQSTDNWTQKADFGGNAQASSVGFSIANKGYAGMGADGSTNYLDFWEWDQATNNWLQKTNFSGPWRNNPKGFSIGSKGYLGTGNAASIYHDLWEYTTDIGLPIELLSFTATPINNNYVSVNWTTVSETNNNYFAVMRSQDGAHFTQIGTTPGAGNSNSILNYVFYDEHPYMGLSYYQLKQVDFNGTYSFSNIAPVYIGTLTIINIYPNPSEDGYIKYTVASGSAGIATVKVIDATGKEVYHTTESIDAGYTTKTLSTATLSNSDYILQIKLGTVEKTQKQFIVRSKK